MVTMQAMKNVYDHLTKNDVFFQTPTKTIVSENQTMVDVTGVQGMMQLNKRLVEQLDAQTDAMIVGAIPFDESKAAAIHVLHDYAVVQSDASNQIPYPKVDLHVEDIASYPTKNNLNEW
ncbi:hypothetical protein [Kurthia senegalensis]|uniref:hypothetical protein n=1 Tax=Kurthia senegalensis TaxID=1033740 RepID=UPI0002895B44|nr:hypothetical protein [Kurthia senegalensis]